MTIEPAVASILTASAPVPADARSKDASFAPVTEIVRSSSSPAEATVMFDACTPSIENPPAVASISIAVDAVPASFNNWIVCDEPASA